MQEVVQIADAWNMMSVRLKLATAGQREFTTAQKELFEIAQRIGVPIQETTTLYGKLQQAVRMLGGEQKDALSITESISQALRLSGASATEAQSSLLQFGQALASGVLRGAEFNSVVETTANLSVSAAVASVGLLKTALGVLGAFLVGWEIRTWLSEKFEIVRRPASSWWKCWSRRWSSCGSAGMSSPPSSCRVGQHLALFDA